MGTTNQGKKSKRVIALKVGASILIFACLFCLGFSIWFYNLDAPDEKSGSEKAKPILAAIQQYKEKENVFPDYLYELTPDFISTVPQPDFRHKYCYDRREDGSSFTLAFVPKGEAIGDGWYVYSSKMDKWISVDSGYWGECDFLFD